MFMASQAQAKTSSDHDEIRRWAEAREGIPSCVKGTGGGEDIGMIRIDFPGYSGEDSLQHISWEEWFDKFDERKLALLFQETTAGGAQSNFNKLVSRETAQESESKSKGGSSGRKSAGGGKKAVAAKKAGGGAKKTAAGGKREAQKSVGGKKTASKAASKKSAASSKKSSTSSKKSSSAGKSPGPRKAAKKSTRGRSR
jgi:hypothetical protein